MTARWQHDAEIFVVSVLILYLELVLIRWIGTEIRLFAYLGNLILVVCFFGVGLGCYLADRPVQPDRIGWNALLLVVLISNPLQWKGLDLKQTTVLLSGFEDLSIWQGSAGQTALQVVAGLLIMGVLLYLVARIFLPAGQILGRALTGHPSVIRAYSVNIVGSLGGVWLFQGLSWAATPPAVWFGVSAGWLLALALTQGERAARAGALAAAAAVVVGVGASSPDRIVWSPYQKLQIRPFVPGDSREGVQHGYLMEVNGTFYQLLLDLSERFVHAHPGALDADLVKRSDYNLPFAFKPDARRVLIVGAGSGNNAAAALRHGVEQVDCVEIDPQIYEVGRQLHPERPYDSSRVRMFINDARAFFKHAEGSYDLIWFGWLDAHTLGSSYNNLRLDHYVYTRESFREARRLLADDGLLVVNFVAQREWIADRLYALLRELFPHEPLVYRAEQLPFWYGVNGVTLIAGRHPVTLDSLRDDASRQALRTRLVSLPGTTRVTTDDWPDLYLESAKLPKLHLLTSLAVVGAVLLVRRRGFGLVGGMDWPFFWLGAAFLLLEVQTVSRATLLFGMTWVVNGIVISAVLVMILAANAVAALWPRLPRWLPVVGLAVTVAGLATAPLDVFNALSGLGKLSAATIFLTAPVFFAGLLFIRWFAVCADKPRALGANLIGALVGGLLETLSFLAGMRALVVLVGLFYLVAILMWRSNPEATQSPTS